MAVHDIEKAKFVEEWVGRANNTMREFIPIWSEVLSNYLVRSPSENSVSTAFPLGAATERDNQFGGSRYLKDPETKQIVDTLLSKLMGSLFTDDGYILAKKRGREDATAADTTSKLLKYFFELDGHHRTTQTWLLDMLLFGTGISQLTWKLDERPRTFRDIVGVDELGQEIREEVRIPNFPVYDDARWINIDIMDFYPDFSKDNFRDMLGAAKRVTLNGFEAMRLAKLGVYKMSAVKAAIAASGETEAEGRKDGKYWRVDRPALATRHPGFDDFEALEYYGQVPWTQDDGEQWRIITIANGQVLRDIPWPFDEYRIPFYDATISPIQGRLYGIGPAEGARYQQDFADFLLMMMADAVARQVRPPILFNKDAGIDAAALAAWRPDVPIGVEDVNVTNAVATLQYSPNIPNGFALFNSIKQSMRENTGAFGSIQGAGLGVNRASATEAERTFQMALDRPEMFATYIEKECLPPFGRGVLKLYQQNLETTEELIDRIGESPEPFVLADIQGDFDIRFTGSRNSKNVQTKLAEMDRIFALAQIPQLANLLPWEEIGIQLLEGMGYDKIAQTISNPDIVKQNLLLQQSAQGGASNGVQQPTKSPNPSTSVSQAFGGTVPEG